MNEKPLGKRRGRRSRKRVLMALAYYDNQLYRGITRFARDADWTLDTSMVHYGLLPHYWTGDGIIASFVATRPEVTEFVLSRNCATLCLYGECPEVNVPRILMDDYEIGRQGAQYFLDRHFEHFAFAQFNENITVKRREAGFRETVLQAGGHYHLLNFTDLIEAESVNLAACFRQMLQSIPKPLALLAQSDHRASLLISLARTVGIAVPDTVSILGIDNNEQISSFAEIPISSINCGREEMAYQGAQLLNELMTRGSSLTFPVIRQPMGIVTRQSSNIYAISNRPALRAMQFIEEHYLEPISVRDVVRASRTNRASLYESFEKLFKRSIGETITGQRVQYASYLLTTTEEKISDIADMSGFLNMENFCRVFKKTLGLRPTEYRAARKNEISQ